MNSYSNLINKEISSVYNTSVSNKIIQYMNIIKNESNDNQARRFLMELMQNAQDLSYTDNGIDIPIKIKIMLTDSNFEFSHNGKIFTVKDILSIIYQASSKTPGEGIGQFGTGFMTTYQLSETVSITSYLKEENNPYQKFTLLLDRSGINKEQILEAIQSNINTLMELNDETVIADEAFDKSEYNTTFSYHLNNDRSKRIAQIGVDDLKNTLPYIMLFSHNIGKVEIILDTANIHESITYTTMDTQPVGNGLVKKYIKKESINAPDDIITLLHENSMINGHNITLACCCNGNNVLPIDNNISKLYISFPLIGSEDFPFPVVINSRQFRPNEPRSGISLTDNEISLDAKVNKAILQDAIVLYEHFLDNLIKYNYNNIQNVLHMPIYNSNKEWSDAWVKENLYEACWNIIEDKHIITCNTADNSKVSIKNDNVLLIQASNSKELKAIQHILFFVNDICYQSDDINWAKIFEGYYTPPTIWLNLNDLIQKAESIANSRLITPLISPQEWVELLYKTSMANNELAAEILAGEINIFVTQSSNSNGGITLKNLRNVKKDPGIPEFLKDVSESLDILRANGEEPINIRDILLEPNFDLGDNSILDVYETDHLINYISRRADRAFRVLEFNLYEKQYMEAWHNAWIIMIANGSNANMKKLASVFYNVNIDTKITAINNPQIIPSVWRTSYRSSIMEMLNTIIAAKEFNTLSLHLNLDENSTLEWLNTLYATIGEFVSYDIINNNNILLNQEGYFSPGRELSIDKMDKELKDVMTAFSNKHSECDILKRLVDPRIKIPDWNIREYRNKEAAGIINNVIQNLLLSISLSETEEIYQNACTRLLGWIDNNSEKASLLFPAFSKEEDRMKLLTSKVAVQLGRKAKELESILTDYGFNNIDELKVRIENASSYNTNDVKEDNYSDETEIYYGGDEYLLGLDAHNRAKRLKEIGNAGEEYVYNNLINFYSSKGYVCTVSAANMCLLVKNDKESIEILKADTDNYTQPGWDIQLKYCSETNDSTTIYYEVKTNTTTSIYSDLIRMSNEQLKVAANYNDNYHLIRLKCDSKTLDIVDTCEYKNPLKCLVDGKLANAEKGYIFREISK